MSSSAQYRYPRHGCKITHPLIFQEKFQENMGGGGESTVRWGELSFMMTTARVGWFEKLSALSMGGVIMGDNFSRVFTSPMGGVILHP